MKWPLIGLALLAAGAGALLVFWRWVTGDENGRES